MKLATKCVALVFAMAVALGGVARAQVITWQNNQINPAGFWAVANETVWAKKVAEATGGRLQIRVFPAGSAGFQGAESPFACAGLLTTHYPERRQGVGRVGRPEDTLKNHAWS